MAPKDDVPSTEASLSTWLDFIGRIHPREIELGLDRVRRVAERLGLTKPATRVITVAGTNGKGSTVKTLEVLLEAAGHATGAYTSPHILRFNERIRLRGVEAEDRALTTCFARIEACRGADSLSYFEFTTLAALMLFADSDLDYALLEVGLGGRLDAVNLVDPDLCIITNISLDHEDWLGRGRENIGAEKAGILRADVPFVCADRDPPESVLRRARELAVTPLLIERDFAASRGGDAVDGWEFRYRSAQGSEQRRRSLPLPALNLDNVGVAMQGLAALGALPEDEVLRAVLGGLSLEGRFESRVDAPSGREVVLDVAHNAAAAELLAAGLESARRGRRIHLVFAAMADKAIEDIVQCLETAVDIWYIAAFGGDRALSAEGMESRLRATLADAEFRRFDSVERAYRAACDEAPHEDALVVVTGSFHTLAEIVALPSLRRSPVGVTGNTLAK